MLKDQSRKKERTFASDEWADMSLNELKWAQMSSKELEWA